VAKRLSIVPSLNDNLINLTSVFSFASMANSGRQTNKLRWPIHFPLHFQYRNENSFCGRCGVLNNELLLEELLFTVYNQPISQYNPLKSFLSLYKNQGDAQIFN